MPGIDSLLLPLRVREDSTVTSSSDSGRHSFSGSQVQVLWYLSGQEVPEMAPTRQLTASLGKRYFQQLLLSLCRLLDRQSVLSADNGLLFSLKKGQEFYSVADPSGYHSSESVSIIHANSQSHRCRRDGGGQGSGERRASL